jgi:hypothetical protein
MGMAGRYHCAPQAAQRLDQERHGAARGRPEAGDCLRVGGAVVVPAAGGEMITGRALALKLSMETKEDISQVLSRERAVHVRVAATLPPEKTKA